MSQSLSYFIVDAFADRPFSGNPAAVVPLDSWPPDFWLQNVAMEMNLSETAYFVPDTRGFHLRWFTPKLEVDLCGHATLATAKALAHMGQLAKGSEVVFSTRSGLLRASRIDDRFQLNFPLTAQEKEEPPAGLIEALNVHPLYVGRSRFDYLVEVASESIVRSLSPDFKTLISVNCRGVIVTSRSDDSRFDFVSRFFAPSAGIDEDPVTGSAHCCLAGFWASRLDKAAMVGYQASARGGSVRVEVRGDRVLLGGEAVIVAQGELLIV
ncbi:MAG TPA: PhzF family phenazine biosynthesis protein [Pirellulales bacterium]|jgi:PhzF family phenazine biosynthesis protein|nr:PhzF family phenazine biosynthesis protein [Pirellulales bacterium]